VSISVASGTRRSRCPLCGRDSSRVHSRYLRTVSDLPWHGISVELEGGPCAPLEFVQEEVEALAGDLDEINASVARPAGSP
jgi:hypothetical protein